VAGIRRAYEKEKKTRREGVGNFRHRAQDSYQMTMSVQADCEGIEEGGDRWGRIRGSGANRFVHELEV